MRRQTATSGINPAGSSRALRLDPLSLPVSFNAHDTRADGGVRQIELHRERVVLRRAIHGMRMAVNVRMRDFLGVALRGIDETFSRFRNCWKTSPANPPCGAGATTRSRRGVRNSWCGGAAALC